MFQASKRSGKGNQVKSRSPRSSSGPAGPCVEPLEDRRLLSGNPLSAQNDLSFTVFEAVGTANVARAQAAFEKAIGGANNGANPPEKANGFRDINWDGVKLDGTDFNGHSTVIVKNKVVGIPVNRFQARGVIFDEVYFVAGDGFASVNPSVAGLLNAFSPKNIFAHTGDTDLGVGFVTPSNPPSQPVQQATRGFSAVFLNVEKPDTSNIEYENGSNTIGTFFAPAGPAGAQEFLGVLFNAPVVTHVDVNPGTAAIFNLENGKVVPGPKDIARGGKANLAAVDNFDYAEPANVVAADVIQAVHGVSFSNTVTTFSDATAGVKASALSATINWGDGTSSAGVITGSAPHFAVKGTHVYKEKGTFEILITIKDKLGHSVLSSAAADVA